MKEIKIIQCTNNKYWYSKQIGNLFLVKDSFSDLDYEVLDMHSRNTSVYFISKSDCEVIRDDI